jgi:hypothetical protein
MFPKNLFIHHVYFWLKNPGDPGDLGRLTEGLKKLSSVATIQSFHMGRPATTSRSVIDNSYSVSCGRVFCFVEPGRCL